MEHKWIFVLIGVVFGVFLVTANTNVVDLGFVGEKSFELAVAQGEVAGHSKVNKFGANPDIDGGFEDIWELGDTYTFLTTAQTLNLTSTDADDTNGGTGANTVQIYGLDENYTAINEQVNLSGGTVAQTTKQYLRNFRMKVIKAGTTETNEGDITAVADLTGETQSQITTGNGQTLMAIYTVPKGKTAYLYEYTYGIEKKTGSSSTIRLKIKEFGSAWQVKSTASGVSAGTSEFRYEYAFFPSYPEKTDIKFEADASAVDTIISVEFELLEVAN